MLLKRETGGGLTSQYSTSSFDDDEDSDTSGDETLIFDTVFFSTIISVQ